MKIYVLILLFLATSITNSFAKNGTILGTINFPLESTHYYCREGDIGPLPKGIPFYNKISGSIEGYFSCLSVHGASLKYIDQLGVDQEIPLDSKDVAVVDYERVAVGYFQEKDGYVNFLRNSVPNGFWIKKSDIESKYIVSWMDFFLKLYKNHPILD